MPVDRPAPGRGSAAAELLEEMQEAAYADTGLLPKIFEANLIESVEDFVESSAPALGLDDSSTAKTREVLASRLRIAIAELPTPYEDVVNYMLLIGLRTSLEASAETLGWVVPHRPLLGTLPLRQLNAVAFRVPDSDEHVVAFQHGVFGFMNLMAKGFAACFPLTENDDGGASFSTDPEEITARLSGDPAIVDRLFDFVGAYVYTGDPLKAHQYFLGGPAGHFAAMLREAAETFLLGHEFGHVIAGHLEHAAAAWQATRESSGEIVTQAWTHEFEADGLGMVLAVQTMTSRGFDLALSYAGIDLVFTTMELTERALAVARYGDASRRATADTHPPALMRRSFLRQQLSRISKDAAAVSGAESLVGRLDSSAEAVWEQLEPRFRAMRAEGRRPSPIWGDSE